LLLKHFFFAVVAFVTQASVASAGVCEESSYKDGLKKIYFEPSFQEWGDPHTLINGIQKLKQMWNWSG
jgi:hypothetical protein